MHFSVQVDAGAETGAPAVVAVCDRCGAEVDQRPLRELPPAVFAVRGIAPHQLSEFAETMRRIWEIAAKENRPIMYDAENTEMIALRQDILLDTLVAHARICKHPGTP